jgi:uncharacterized short protein YbdD (DUF466 family)
VQNTVIKRILMITLSRDRPMLTKTLAAVARVSRAARLMLGMPDYDGYLAFMATHHPDEPVMAYEAFFREREKARYSQRQCNARCC